MKIYSRPLAWLILILVLTSNYNCQKNPDVNVPPIDPIAETVIASIKGRVIDENSKPVNNASVAAGSVTTSTDINGYFRFDNIQLSKNAGFVLVEKTGYFKGSRTIFTNANILNNVEIQLIPKTDRGSFTASAGGNIVVQTGTSVNFPASAVINTATNIIYSGTVRVLGAYLDPTDPRLPLIMPGNLVGLTTGNEQKILQTFGMIAVELEGSSGEKLNLAPGQTATITMAIPASLQASAPATIPLWFFDETKGLWKQEGSATKQGGNYVGTVSHFSFWNCDVPNDFVNLKLKLKNQSNLPAIGYKIILRNTVNNSTAYAITDSSGAASGAVPPSVSIEMKVYNRCNALVHTQTIGPFNSATDLGTISINTPSPANITVSGTVTNCNSTAVANGYADVIVDGLDYRTAITNGNFSITIERCDNSTATAEVIATDVQNLQQSTPTTINVTAGNFSAGAISACGVSTLQFVNYLIAGTQYNFIPPADSLRSVRQNTTTNIVGFRNTFDSTNYQYTSFNFNGITTPGTYTLSTGTFIVTKGFNLQYNDAGPITITITEYGGTGQYIAGSFTGPMREFFTNAAVTGSCNFRVRRSF